MLERLKRFTINLVALIRCKCRCSNCIIRKEENTTTIHIEYIDEENKIVTVKDIEML